MDRTEALYLLILCAVGSVAAAATGPAPSVAIDAGDAAARCAALDTTMRGSWPDASTAITSTLLVTASAVDAKSAAGASLPAHCEVVAQMQSRRGQLGQTYAIRFHLRLPLQWNGRFLFQGGGGSNGVTGDALGRYSAVAQPALLQGFAVVSQDSGHDNATNNDPAHAGTLVFGFDAQARSNYGHASLPLVAAAAKAVIGRYYGTAPAYSYFVGCSKGGQEALAMTQRYPAYFDGVLAGAPAMSLPRAAVAEAWDTQAFAKLARSDASATPTLDALAQVFSDGQMQRVRDAILRACDADDGVRDGMVAAFSRCTTVRVMPELRKQQCRASATGDCLQPEQISALAKVMNGARDSKGRSLYADWPWDVGLAAAGWRAWKTGLPDGTAQARNVLLGSASLASVFTTPPTALSSDPNSLLRFQLGFDFDRDAPLITATTESFPQSAWSEISARSSDLDRFRDRGGRLIVYHGVSDPVFSINDTIAWWGELTARYAARLKDFARLFPVPGMNHCGGGDATDSFDALAALMAWVEGGQAPEQIRAQSGPASPWPNRQRPLCPFPAIARYRGSGNIEQSESFLCRS